MRSPERNASLWCLQSHVHHLTTATTRQQQVERNQEGLRDELLKCLTSMACLNEWVPAITILMAEV